MVLLWHAARKLEQIGRSNGVVLFRVDKLKMEENLSTGASSYIRMHATIATIVACLDSCIMFYSVPAFKQQGNLPRD